MELAMKAQGHAWPNCGWSACVRCVSACTVSQEKKDRGPWYAHAAKHALYDTEISNLVIGVADTSISSV